MQVREITEDYAVAPQIAPEDVPEIAARGFRTIVCNRPDGEEPGQPAYAEVAAAAEAAGLRVVFLPVVSGQITEKDVERFRSETADVPTPVLAYCRSGARSQNLWLLAR